MDQFSDSMLFDELNAISTEITKFQKLFHRSCPTLKAVFHFDDESTSENIIGPYDNLEIEPFIDYLSNIRNVTINNTPIVKWLQEGKNNLYKEIDHTMNT
ncbi:MAG: hypothetical protein EOP45_21435 [Sphingobacteriaceae bacterium]|nr:MAG: hypothetical protein EOP45_21435 [Sphingobacteriaceae bacterium]